MPSLLVAPISNQVVLNNSIPICNSYIRIMKAQRAIKISDSFIRKATTSTVSKIFNWQTWEIPKLIDRLSFHHRCKPQITIRGKACCWTIKRWTRYLKNEPLAPMSLKWATNKSMMHQIRISKAQKLMPIKTCQTRTWAQEGTCLISIPKRTSC